MDRFDLLLQCTVGAYGLACLAHGVSLRVGHRAIVRSGGWLTGLAFLLHTVLLGFRWQEVGGEQVPWIFFSWMVMVAKFAVLIRERISGDRTFSVLGVCAFASGLLILAIPLRLQGAELIGPVFRSRAFWVHRLTEGLAFGWLSAGAITTVFQWLASLNWVALGDRLASPPELERMSYRLILLGLPFQVLAMASGGIWAFQARGSYWNWDPKEIWALIAVLFFAIHLNQRLSPNVNQRSDGQARPLELSVWGLLGLFFLTTLHGLAGG